MKNEKMIDHLFRQQYGKMVSILIRIFGLQHLETIEDAVQDTFIKAVKSWQGNMPVNPEAWLVKSAKNRVLDLFRKIGAEDKRIVTIASGVETIAINELFLEHEIDDSVLQMIFTACNPLLNSKEQIAFSLKIISGFSGKEIANALLLKEETVKKRLSRARNVIHKENIIFEIPNGNGLLERLDRVLEVVYLIFNEGFHSNRRDVLIREELCGEAIRLTKILLTNNFTATPKTHAIFALFCFQSSRLRSKIDKNGDVIPLDKQDRSLWFLPLITLGNEHMINAVESDVYSSYHYEAAIINEHLKVKTISDTNWKKILEYYEHLFLLEPTSFNRLNMVVVNLKLKYFDEAKKILMEIDPLKLVQKAYLYYGTYAEYSSMIKDKQNAILYIDKAIELVNNEGELNYLQQKREKYRVS